jgi:hypothetical protein
MLGKLFLHPFRRIGEWVWLGMGIFIAYCAVVSWPFWTSNVQVLDGELFCEPGSGRFDAGTCAVDGERFDLRYLGVPRRRLREVSFQRAQVTVLRTERTVWLLDDELLGIEVDQDQLFAPSRAYAVRIFEMFAFLAWSGAAFAVALIPLRTEKTLLQMLKARIEEERARKRR